MNNDLQQLYTDNKKHLSKEAKAKIKSLIKDIKHCDKQLIGINQILDSWEKQKLSKEVEMIFIIFTNNYENPI